MLFSTYGISIEHPDDWQIYICPGKTFAYHDGMVKIDKSGNKKKALQTSLAVRWARTEKPIDIHKYIEEMKNQYERKQKKNKADSYAIYSIDPVDHIHPAYMVHSGFRANHSIYRILGKDEDVECLQLSTFCEETGRIVIATITAVPVVMQNSMAEYKATLKSLRCHEEYETKISQVILPESFAAQSV